MTFRHSRFAVPVAKVLLLLHNSKKYLLSRRNTQASWYMTMSREPKTRRHKWIYTTRSHQSLSTRYRVVSVHLCLPVTRSPFIFGTSFGVKFRQRCRFLCGLIRRSPRRHLSVLELVLATAVHQLEDASRGKVIVFRSDLPLSDFSLLSLCSVLHCRMRSNWLLVSRPAKRCGCRQWLCFMVNVKASASPKSTGDIRQYRIP